MLVSGIASGGPDRAAYARWIAAVHQVARETGAAVAGPADPPHPGRNHYRVRVGSLRLLLHAPAGLVAAVDDADLAAPFREVPRADLFELAGFRVLAPADLERRLTDALTAELTEAERRDVAYHRTARVGDVIFNWFD